MKSKLPAVAVFIFVLIVMYFLFPRGCRDAGSAIPGADFQSAKMKGSVWI